MLLKDNILYKAMLKHHSQGCIKQARGIINADSVFWLRRTDSLTYSAKIEVSSGDSCHLKEFRTLNVDDISKNKNYIYEDYLWAPVGNDKEKFVICYFDKPQNISLCVLAGNIENENQILSGKLELSNGFSIAVNELYKLGRERIISFPKQENIFWLKFNIISYRGSNPGLSKIEIFSDDRTDFKIIKFMIDDNFVYEWYILPHIKKLKFSIYKYGVEKTVVKFIAGSASVKEDYIFFEGFDNEIIVRIEDMFDSSCYDQIVIKRISYIDYFRLSLIRFRDYVENYFLKKRD